MRETAVDPPVDPAGFEAVAEHLPAMMWRTDRDGEFAFVNGRWLEFTGRDREDETGMGWLRGVHPDDLRDFVLRFGEACEAGVAFALPCRLRRHDGTYRRLVLRGRPLVGEGEAFHGFLGDCVQAPDPDRQADDRRLVADEVNHRVKNVLFSVQALARQTMWGTRELEAAYDRFTGRLVAMAQAHDLLIDEDWRGTSMGSLVRRVAAPYGREGVDYDVHGADVRVAPQLSLSLALCLHELFVNSTNFGALSGKGGRVSVDWAATGPKSDPLVRLRWRETGGEPARLPPALAELGTALIHVVGRDGAEAGRGERQRGLTCLIEFPGSGPEDRR
jgi:PAS domain S-box-containing protein